MIRENIRLHLIKKRLQRVICRETFNNKYSVGGQIVNKYGFAVLILYILYKSRINLIEFLATNKEITNFHHLTYLSEFFE